MDIETNTLYNNVDGEYIPALTWMYLGCIMGNDLIPHHFHTWDEYRQIVRLIGKDKIIFVHNLEFEFEFLIKNGFKFSKIIANSRHHPISVTDKTYGHVYRCSYKFFDKSLKKLGDEIGCPKLEYKYSGMRLKENLTDKDYEYNARDCEIIIRAMQIELDKWKKLKSVPLTKTGIVRRRLMDEDKYGELHNRCERAFPDEELYNMLERSFTGGFTYGNPAYFAQPIYNCNSFDRKSAYPAEMLTQFFPQKFGRVHEEDAQDVFNRCGNCHFIAELEFNDIIAIDPKLCAIPFSKIMYGSVVNRKFNGKIQQAEKLIITLDSVGYKNYARLYDFDRNNVKCNKISLVTSMRRLPTPLIKTIGSLALEKERIGAMCKARPEDIELTRQYKFVKEMINALYGANVQKFRDFIYNITDSGDWDIPIEQEYKRPRNLIRTYAWGCWITSYSRLHLIDAILEMGTDDFAYCDTDSVKGTGVIDTNKNFIDIDTLEYLSGILNEDELNAVRRFGSFEKEYSYDKFMHVGAKKYFYDQNAHFGYTVAGLPKLEKGRDYGYFPTSWDDIKENAVYDNVKLAHRIINNKAVGPFYYMDEYEEDGKTQIRFIEFPTDKIPVDIGGGGIALYPTSYTLNAEKLDCLYASDYGCTWKGKNAQGKILNANVEEKLLYLERLL